VKGKLFEKFFDYVIVAVMAAFFGGFVIWVIGEAIR